MILSVQAMRKPNFFLLALLVLAMQFNFAHALSAQAFKVAINVAGRQRMLTQKITKVVFLETLIGKSRTTSDELNQAMLLFSHSLYSLLKGDRHHHIPKPPTQSILQQYKTIKRLFNRKFAPLVTKIHTANHKSSNALRRLGEISSLLLKSCDEAVTSYVKASKAQGYNGINQQINLAGRQRMLTQKIARDVFMVAAKIAEVKAKNDTTLSIQLFEHSLAKLKKASAKSSHRKKIAKQIKTIFATWRTYKISVTTALKAKDFHPHILETINTQSNRVLLESDNFVKLLESSKSQS